jgi:alpha-tubulin suppressor-like RCC1 family protein
LKKTKNQLHPEYVTNVKNERYKEIVEVSAGGGTLGMRLNSGEVLLWGENKDGQVCDGEEGGAAHDAVPYPTVVAGLEGRVTKIAIGGQFAQGGHDLFLMENGTLKACGDNKWGQLGDGSTGNSDKPVEVKKLAGVSQISASDTNSIALEPEDSMSPKGTAYVWGEDEYGQLGSEAAEKCIIKTKKEEQNIPCEKSPVSVKLEKVEEISAGLEFSTVIDKNEVYAFGRNDHGQLGTGDGKDVNDTPEPVPGTKEAVELDAGYWSSIARINGTDPEPTFVLTPEVKGLKLTWVSSDNENKWEVYYRVKKKEAESLKLFKSYEGTKREAEVTGLESGVRYEVVLKSKSLEHTIEAYGIPL